MEINALGVEGRGGEVGGGGGGWGWDHTIRLVEHAWHLHTPIWGRGGGTPPRSSCRRAKHHLEEMFKRARAPPPPDEATIRDAEYTQVPHNLPADGSQRLDVSPP